MYPDADNPPPPPPFAPYPPSHTNPSFEFPPLTHTCLASVFFCADEGAAAGAGGGKTRAGASSLVLDSGEMYPNAERLSCAIACSLGRGRGFPPLAPCLRAVCLAHWLRGLT